MKKKGFYRLIAGVLCVMIVLSENSICTLASTEPLKVEETEEATEETTEIETIEESVWESSDLQEEVSTDDEESEVNIEETSLSEEASVDSEEFVAETVSEETEAESVEVESTESEEVSSVEDIKIELDADGNIASGVIDESYGQITWVIDAAGKLTIEGTGNWYDPTKYNGIIFTPWFYYGTEIKSAECNITGMTHADNLFASCENLESIELSGFDTSNVVTMSEMFCGCSSLKELDLSNFNTSKTTNMDAMFCECESLEELNISSFDTANVQYMGIMFQNCSSLEKLDVSSFDTSNVTYMAGMFDGCSSLKRLDLSNFNTCNVEAVYNMFSDCSSLETLDISNFNTNNIGNRYYGMSGMFGNCSSLRNLDVSSFNTSNVSSMSGMFGGCSSLRTLDLSNFDTSNVNSISGMFSGCSSLENIDLSNFDTSNVVGIDSTFSGCGSLKYLDLSTFNTSNVDSMMCLFQDCTMLEKIDISNFDTSNVVHMSGMFENCISLKELDLSSFNTSKLEFMSDMFLNCSSLKSLDISNFDTSNVRYMENLFSGCSSLEYINLSNFDTSSAGSFECMFQNCSSLIDLDLHSFDTKNISNMRLMFSGCSSLKNLDISNFYTDNVWLMEYMFRGCSSLESLDWRKGLINQDVSYAPDVFAECGKLSKIVAPVIEADISISLPGKSSDTWYTSAGEIATELPVGLTRSITIAKNRIPEEENITSTAEMAEIPKDKAIVLVYDQTTLEVIENASVTVNGADVYPTDGAGMVFISATDEEVSYELTVAAEGYEITETVQNMKNGKLARVGLKPEGSDLAVASVTGSMGNIRYDLLRDKIVWGYMSDISSLTNTTEQTMTIDVKANEDVKTYSIIDQNGKQYFTSTDGTFEIKAITSGTTSDNNTISTRMPVTDKLTDGKYYYVQIETTDGRKTREKIGISLTKNYVTAEKMYQKAELSIGEKIEVTLPESIPILGGMKCKFDLDKDAPLEINIDEEGVVRVTYNKPTDEELDEFAKKYKGMAKKASQNAKMKLNKVPGAIDKFGMGFGSVSGKVYGYGEGNLKEAAEGGKLTVTLQIGAEIEGEIGYKQYFIIGAVPINVYMMMGSKVLIKTL